MPAETRWRPLGGLIPDRARQWIGAKPKQRRLLLIGALATWALLPGPQSLVWPLLIPVGLGVAGFRRRSALARAARRGWRRLVDLRHAREPVFDQEPILDSVERSPLVDTRDELRQATIDLGETTTGLERVMRGAPEAPDVDLPAATQLPTSASGALDHAPAATVQETETSMAGAQHPAAGPSPTQPAPEASPVHPAERASAPTQCTVDRVVAMHGRDGVPIRARVRVFERATGKPIVVYSPVAPDTPVTPAAPILATRIRDALLRGEEAEYIEHHPRALAPHGTETFTRVAFERGRRSGYERPRWTPVSRSEVETTLGRRLTSPRLVARRLGGHHEDLFLT